MLRLLNSPVLYLINLSNSKHVICSAIRCSSKWTDSKCVQLSYLLEKPSEKRKVRKFPVVFLHGLFGSKHSMLSVAREIGQQTERSVICVDLRNHGNSPHVDEMNYRVMVDDVAKMLWDLYVREAVIVGHGMGGKVAMAMALLRPSFVSRLVVVDTVPGKSKPVAETPDMVNLVYRMSKFKLAARKVQNIEEKRQQADVYLQSYVEDEAVRQFLLANLVDFHGQYRWKVNLAAVGWQLNEILRFPHFHGSYYGDALFLGGANSNIVGPDDVTEIKRLFPEASVRHVDGAGHWVYSQQPHLFVDAVVNFINTTIPIRTTWKTSSARES